MRKEKSFGTAEIDKLFDFARRIYVINIRFEVPVNIIANDKHVFRDTKLITAAELSAITKLADIEMETEIISAATVKGLTLVCTNSNNIKGAMSYIVDTKTKKKEVKPEETTPAEPASPADSAAPVEPAASTAEESAEPTESAEPKESAEFTMPAKPTKKSKKSKDGKRKEKKEQKPGSEGHSKAKVSKSDASTTETGGPSKADVDRWSERQTNLAVKIWEEVKSFDNSEEFGKLNEFDQLKFFQSRYANFNKQHPLILRYMVQALQFHPTAFRKYLVKLASGKKTADAFFEHQADYVVLLWKELTPKYNTKKAKELWETTFNTIKREADSYKELQNNADIVATKIEERLLNDFKSELAESLDKHGCIPEIITSKDERLQYMARKIELGEESSEDERPVDL